MTAKPSVKQAPKPKGPGSDEPFTYTTRSGEQFTITSLAVALSAGEIRKLRKEPSVEWAFYVIERDCSPEELAVFDAMSAEELNDDFMRQWNEHSGIDLGNSKAS